MTPAKHFGCTVCGKCCYGLLPLTCSDALAHAALFPLCLLWTPVRQGARGYELTAKLGATITMGRRQSLAVLITPTAYIPASLPCPALRADGLCAIHEAKPSRCRTMPFYPYREERYQAELLIPRAGWACDTSEAAPVVFEHGRITAREDFDRERAELLLQVPTVRKYAEYMMKYAPALPGRLVQAAQMPTACYVVTSLSSFLTATHHPDSSGVARQQLPVLEAFAVKTAADASLGEFNDNYRKWAEEMTYLAKGT